MTVFAVASTSRPCRRCTISYASVKLDRPIVADRQTHLELVAEVRRRPVVALGARDDRRAACGDGVPVSSRQHVRRHCSKYVKYTAWLTWPIAIAVAEPHAEPVTVSEIGRHGR